MLNILDLSTGEVLLGVNVPDYKQAYYWLDYYRYNYGPGVPYPNGKGCYDGKFMIVRACECCGIYSAVH